MLTTSLAPGASCGGTTLTVRFSVPVSRVLLATVEGGLNLATAPELDTRVRAELRRREPHRLVMDLSGLEFLGLQGTAVFERLRRGAAADGTGVILVGLSAAGERALRFTGVLERFPRHTDLPAALIVAGRGHRRPSAGPDTSTLRTLDGPSW
jgi:anti-sigma B factor antagonist